MESLCENSVTGDYSVEGLIPKKVQFRDNDESVNIDWLVDQDVQPTISWKDKLVGLPSNTAGNDLDTKEDFDVLEGDIQKSIVNVQQWSVSFNPAQTFPSIVMSWIRFPGLPSYMYKRKILVEMGGMVSKIVKLDMNTDNIAKGRFARMVVYVNLDRYGYMKDVGPFRLFAPYSRKNLTSSELLLEGGNMTGDGTGENSETYGPWMLVKKKSRRKSRNSSQIDTKTKMKKNKGSRFKALTEMENIVGIKASDRDENLDDDGVSLESGSTFSNDGNNEFFESCSRSKVTSEGVVDVTEAEMNNYLDPRKHTMINFKEFKDPSSGISMEGAPLQFLGEVNQRQWGEI
ncbi:hypothetical protein Goari_020517 [Gossypium aridum]|uniref:DUF4283 domain-containing protein n=1 Tax=Gossypium aridum TaxID=34290 RepID=A0A7J8YQ71_GOSAI|nr:hypothetical protein [Gossypium aridum]